MKKVMIIFGTRPEAIKMAPVIKKLKANRSKVKTITCVTAQHRQMLDQVLALFGIMPDYDLNIMKGSQSLFDVTVDGLRKLEDVLQKEKPDIILVQGDTTTTLIASLAAFYLKIKIGHIEAGLRTHNKYNPFPEKINRRLADRLADLYFVHTERAKRNLLNEGIDEGKIFVTGNTVLDALFMIVEKQKSKRIQKEMEQQFLKQYGISLNSKKLILVTGHRRESFGKDFENICHGLKMIAENNHNVYIVYPVHLNPNVQKPVREILSNVKDVCLIEPLDYFPSFVFKLKV
jgi:UDP-N-acetylglucosamine 2-epimerase (non-hydrolysing)